MFVPGGTIASIASSTSSDRTTSTAGSWLVSCSIVRGPMIDEVTPGCAIVNAIANCGRLTPAYSATPARASAASSLRWLIGSDRS